MWWVAHLGNPWKWIPMGEKELEVVGTSHVFDWMV